MVKWPQTFITAFGFAGRPEENGTFGGIRADMARLAPCWSQVVVTPENAQCFFARLPGEIAVSVRRTYEGSLRKCGEQAELAKFAALYALGAHMMHWIASCWMSPSSSLSEKPT